MIEQLKTIRAGLETATCYSMLGVDAHSVQIALTALTQLGAMVGSQEPVAWCPALTYPGHEKDRAWANGKPRKEDIEYWTLNGKGITYAYAAPPAQQYKAGDMASAFAQGFRDGVASVAQQQEPVAWAMPKGDGTFIDVITPAEHARDEGSYTVPLFAHPVAQQPTFDARRALEAIEALLSNIRRDAPSLSGKVMGFAEEVAAALRDKVAQQPQARPDFTDEWAGYLKDGETPFERFLRERKDVQSALKLYQRALEENERLKAQQPQAESLESLLSTAIGLLMGYEDRDGQGARKPYKPGSAVANFVAECVERLKDWPMTTAPQQPQAEAVPVCKTCKGEGEGGWEQAHSSTNYSWVKCADCTAPKQPRAEPRQQYVWGYAVRNPKEPQVPHNLAYSKEQADAQSLQFYCVEIIPLVAAAPQQAEGVPPDVVRDAERWRTFLATRPANTHAVINDAIDAAMAKGEKS